MEMKIMSNIQRINVRYVNSKLNDNYDIFICSASFEERCRIIPKKIKGKEFNKVIIFENRTGGDILLQNSSLIQHEYKKNCKLLSVDYSDPLMIADQLAKTIGSIQGRKLRVLIDISTFTHEALLICMKVLRLSKKIDAVTYVYLNASEYCPNATEIKKKWLSRGCKNVHSILGYPGMLYPSLKTHLIVIVGYEYNRAFDMISTIEPNSISLVYGEPSNSTTIKDKEANKVFNDLVAKMAFEYTNIKSLVAPCDDPIELSRKLHNIYSEHENENIVVVPMNNKLSTLGVALSVFENERIQVCYAPAVMYNEENYSIPGKNCYIFVP